MKVDYNVNRSPHKFNDYVASAIVTDIQIDFIFGLITNRDPLVTCYDQEEYDEYVREENH